MLLLSNSSVIWKNAYQLLQHIHVIIFFTNKTWTQRNVNSWTVKDIDIHIILC